MDNTFAQFSRKRLAMILAGSLAIATLSPLACAVPLYYSSQGSGSNSGKVSESDPATGIGSSTFVSYIDPEEVSATNGNLFVTDFRDGTVGEFNDKTGGTINSSLVTGLGGPNGILAYGNNLYISGANGTVAEYQVNNGVATAENTSLIALTGNAAGTYHNATGYQLALYKNTLFVADAYANAVDAYTLNNNGTKAVSASLAFTIPFGFATGLALYGNTLLVSDPDGTVGEYNATNGSTINSMYLTSSSSTPANGTSATSGAYNLVVTGNSLLVASYYTGNITQFDLTAPNPGTGTIVVTGVSQLTGLAVDTTTPEPGTVGLMSLAAFGFLARRRRIVARASH